MANLILSPDLKPIDSLNWLYHLHYVRGEYEIVQNKIKRFSFKSDYSNYIMGLIELNEPKGDVSAALEYFNQIKSANNPVYLKIIIRSLLLMGKHSKVVDLIRESALLSSPNDWHLWHMLGISHFHLNNLYLAKDAFSHAIQYTNKPGPYVFLCRVHVADGDIGSAIAVLRRAHE